MTPNTTPITTDVPSAVGEEEQLSLHGLEPLLPLSDRDRDLFLDLLDNPPEPTGAFRKAAEAYRKQHG